MGHIEREKTKLLNRLKRLRGQIEAIEHAVSVDQECSKVLQQATPAAVRSTASSLKSSRIISVNTSWIRPSR